MRLLPAVDTANPNYKNTVGEFIYEYVEETAGEDKAPKITGMLIDLPIDDIRTYMIKYDKLVEKINEAIKLLPPE